MSRMMCYWDLLIVCHDWRTRDPSTSRTGKYRTATRWLYAVEGAFATA